MLECASILEHSQNTEVWSNRLYINFLLFCTPRNKIFLSGTSQCQTFDRNCWISERMGEGINFIVVVCLFMFSFFFSCNLFVRFWKELEGWWEADILMFEGARLCLRVIGITVWGKILNFHSPSYQPSGW